ncbi:MAG: methyl-accepting chemotaxis protein [Roseburia sp.]|nr:methyl-accepting chemotaxis protein [Roseburia sp.]
MKKQKKQKKQRVRKPAKFRRISSIQVKVNALVLLGIVISAAVITWSMISYTEQLIIDSAYAKMTNIVNSYGAMVDRAETENEATILDAAGYEALLAGLKVDGSESSYCYVIDKNGLIQYHVDSSRNGMPNKNKVITSLIGNLNKGVVPDNLCAEYEENGEMKYASYYITSIKSVVVMCADGNELMSPVRELIIRAIILILIILVFAMILSNLVIRRFTKPLGQVTHIINDTAKLKLQLPANMNKLCRRRDETGLMSRAVKEMSDSLHEVVEKIEQANQNIRTNMEQLESSSNQVHIFCTDNSATTQELAAGTQEVSGMTNLMTNHVNAMRKQFEEINRETETSNRFSEEIAGRARNMQESTQQAIRQTRDMYQQIKDKTAQAMSGLQAVSKINELTSAIIEISDQTSLLSLNASIEAARAGEAGKGFAVVATEISNLAHRSLDTVADIDTIILEVNAAVSKISDSLEETTAFLENSVLVDYDNFNQISNQYLKDADTFRDGMNHISHEADRLNESIQEVSETVERIHTTIEETALGVNDIAEKTSNVVEATSDNYQLTNDTVTSVNELKTIVEKFDFE